MNYFAYGSNMCTNRLRQRVPSCRRFAVATLGGYNLKFHKRSTDGSGKCNAFRTGNEGNRVLGVVYEIDDSQKPALDEAEGLGKGYNETPAQVLSQGRETIAACMYIADPNYIDDSLRPYTWYKDFVVQGAREHELPAEYVRELETVEAREDSNRERAERKRDIMGRR